jgi:hypothetical protein
VPRRRGLGCRGYRQRRPVGIGAKYNFGMNPGPF